MGFGLILLLILYIIWDVNYFIRCVFTVAMGRLFQRKRKISETTTIYGMWEQIEAQNQRQRKNTIFLLEIDFDFLIFIHSNLFDIFFLCFVI